ncbi:MAG: hypothetical protein EXS10_01515 [Phycisphaerales bacterium]|nr:hypothetical protein [Phycisphaerales bacterium]
MGSFLLILLGFGLLIVVHELGHFAAAKWAGVRADGFAVGMGPVLVSYRKGVGCCFGSADARVVAKIGKRPIECSDEELAKHGLGETEYSLRALPLGGYVRMLGQEDGQPVESSNNPRSFAGCPIPKRIVIILAGIAANLLLAIVLFLGAFLHGVNFEAPIVGALDPEGAAAKAGIRAGDRVLSSDGERIDTFNDLVIAAAMSRPESPMSLTLARSGSAGGETIAVSVEPTVDAASGLRSLGIAPTSSATLTAIKESDALVRAALLSAGLPASITPGARLESLNGATIANYADAQRIASASDGTPLASVWTLLDRTRVEAPLQPRAMFSRFRSLNADGGLRIDEGLVGLAPLCAVEAIDPSSRNSETLRPGDVFLSIGDLAGPKASDLIAYVRAHPKAEIPAKILRRALDSTGAMEEIALDLNTDGDGRVGVYLHPAWDLPLLARSVLTDKRDEHEIATPAASLAIVPTGKLLALNLASISSFYDLRAALRRVELDPTTGTASLQLTVQDPREGATPSTMLLELSADDLTQVKALGWRFPLDANYFDPEYVLLSADGDPLRAVSMGFKRTYAVGKSVFATIDRVARGTVSATQLQGPIGILHVGTRVADEGLSYLVFFLALLSVNLAVVNALPIPIADGGLLLFALYEGIRGKAPSVRFQSMAVLCGIIFVAALFLFTFANDMRRLLGL